MSIWNPNSEILRRRESLSIGYESVDTTHTLLSGRQFTVVSTDEGRTTRNVH